MEGAAREVWASHQVTAATLALEVALGVLLMAHVGKLRQNVESTTQGLTVHGCFHPQYPSLQIPYGWASCVSLHGLSSHQAILGGSWPVVRVRADISQPLLKKELRSPSSATSGQGWGQGVLVSEMHLKYPPVPQCVLRGQLWAHATYCPALIAMVLCVLARPRSLVIKGVLGASSYSCIVPVAF